MLTKETYAQIVANEKKLGELKAANAEYVRSACTHEEVWGLCEYYFSKMRELDKKCQLDSKFREKLYNSSAIDMPYSDARFSISKYGIRWEWVVREHSYQDDHDECLDIPISYIWDPSLVDQHFDKIYKDVQDRIDQEEKVKQEKEYRAFLELKNKFEGV